jgi:hypothetical protein
MVGDRKRQQVIENIKDAARETADKVGGLLVALFAIAAGALLIGVAALLLAVRTRARVA